ncbi:hypothetical protein OXX79_009373 [Metschnikowia pulcherrima]
MKLILALCAAALVSAATEDSISPRNSVPTGAATPDPIYGSDNLGNIDYETILFNSVSSEEAQKLGFTDNEMSAYANQFENWLRSRREGRIYPAGIDEIIDDKSIVGGKAVFNLTEERRVYFNNLLRDLVDEETQKDIFNLPPGTETAPGMPAASTQVQPPSAGTDTDINSSRSGSNSLSSTSPGNQTGATVPTGMPGYPGNSSDDDITSTMSSAANGTSLNGTDATGFNGTDVIGLNGTDATGLNGTSSTGLNGTDAMGSAGLNSTGNGTTSRNSTGSGAAGRNGTRNDTVSSRTSAAGAARAVQEWTIAGGIAAAALCLLS